MSYPITPNPVIHQPTKQSVAPVSTPISSGTLQAWGTQFVEGIVGKVASALTGGLVNQNSVQVVANWANGIGSDISGVTGNLSTLANNLLHNADTVIGNIEHVVFDGVNTVQDFLNSLGSAFGGAATGHTVSSVYRQSVALANQAQDAEATALALSWQAQQASGSTTTGAVYEMDIAGADGAALPTGDWSAVSNAVVRVPSSIAVAGLAAGTTAGYMNCAHQYTTDTQSIAVVTGAGGDSTAGTILHFHCDSAYTTGIYLKITTHALELGYFSGAYGSRTYTAFGGTGSVSVSVPIGSRVEVRNSAANSYDLVINGIVQSTYVDTAAHAVSGNHYAQITFSSGTAWDWAHFNSWTVYSFWVSAVMVADYVLPAYVGSGARMYRTSTSNVSTAGILASSYFGVLDNSTSDITVDLTNSKFTVSTEGRYLVTMRSKLSINVGAYAGSSYVTPQLYINGALARLGDDSFAYYSSSDGIGGGVGSMNGTWSVYLHPNDYVQVGWTKSLNVGASATVTGEATGTQTYFSIDLMTKKGS